MLGLDIQIGLQAAEVDGYALIGARFTVDRNKFRRPEQLKAGWTGLSDAHGHD
ncbi:MAG TPA: hypothetical protein VHQ22_18810 [Terriglobales bacterium]|jgi:hypothetical protein|nr:hypothetical protein [Terriglobales bacterium]